MSAINVLKLHIQWRIPFLTWAHECKWHLPLWACYNELFCDEQDCVNDDALFSLLSSSSSSSSS